MITPLLDHATSADGSPAAGQLTLGDSVKSYRTMGKPHIRVLINPRELQQKAHLIRILGEIWSLQGYKVTFGESLDCSADVAVRHVDRSRLSPISDNSDEAGIRIANGNSLDITKRTVSEQLLESESDWRGPVIVKTDANAHAAEDFILEKVDIRRLARMLSARVVPWQWVGELPLRHYPVLESINLVPSWVWQNRELIVERFLPEMDDGAYVLRIWVFLGKQEYGMKIRSLDPVVKSRNVVSVEMLDEVPSEVRTKRREFGLDFGKIDYVMHRGKPIVLDANKTPVIRRASREPNEVLERIASGIEDFLP